MISTQQLDLNLLQQGLQIDQKLTFLWPNQILTRNFALAGEIIHDHKFLFYAIVLT